MRAAWGWCAAIGIIAFTCSGLFARTTSDIAAMFGSEPCTSTFVAAQKTGLLLDGLAFIPSYTGFLILAAIAAGARGRVKTVLITMFLVAAISDEIEGFLLNAILDQLPGTPALLGALWWAVHVKFALLGFGTWGVGELVARGRLFRRLFAAAIVPGSMLAIFGLMAAPAAWMMTGFTIAWVALLLAALTASFVPSLFAAPAAQQPDQAAPSA